MPFQVRSKVSTLFRSRTTSNEEDTTDRNGRSGFLSRFVRSRTNQRVRPRRSNSPELEQPSPLASPLPVLPTLSSMPRLNRALFHEKVQAIDVWKDQATLIRATQEHVAEKLRGAYADKHPNEYPSVLFALGDVARSPACLMVQIAALVAVKKGAGSMTPTLLVQQMDDSVYRTELRRVGPLQRELPAADDKEFSARIAGARGASGASGVPSSSNMTIGLLLAAKQLGFKTGGAYLCEDMPRTDGERELAMVNGIRQRLPESDGPLVVIAGRACVPALMEQFDEHHAFAMATVDHDFGTGGLERYARHSALLTNAAIKPYRNATSLTDARFTNFLEFCRMAGVPLG